MQDPGNQLWQPVFANTFPTSGFDRVEVKKPKKAKEHMLMKKTLLASIVLSGSMLTGCASIVSDSVYPVAINSSPNGATFTVKNREGVLIDSGNTPETVMLKSGDGYFHSATYTITFHKQGYDDKVVELQSKMDGWYFGNILLGGVIGMVIVDPATGAMWKLPNQEITSLVKSTGKVSQADPRQLRIVSIDNVPQSDRSKLVRIR